MQNLKIKGIKNYSDEVIYDLSFLKELEGDDGESVKIILEMFLKNMPETLDKMKICYDTKDWESLYQIAHFAKSTLGVIKAEQMFKLASELELNAKFDRNRASAKSNIQKLFEFFSMLKTKLLIEIEKISALQHVNLTLA